MKPRVFAKSDANSTELVKFIRSLGASFQYTHSIPGALDGIIGYRGVDQRVEIKDPAKQPSARKLTDAEKEIFESWRGRKPIVIETIDDVTDLLFKITKEKLS